MAELYNAFGPHMKRLFGQKVHKVNIDAGFTCPNRDGTLNVTGCIYCDNASFRPSSCAPELSVTRQIQNGISYLRGRYGAEKFLAYFQPYTNTYADVATLSALYKEALSEPSVIGLAIGTRPDCVDTEKLDMLERLARDHYVLVEYGLQSIYDKTLSYINRGHDYKAFTDALEITAGRGIHIGVHTMAGFPTETLDEALHMAEVLSFLPEIGYLKLHQLQIIRNTPMAREYEKSPFYVFPYEEYISFAAAFLERLRPDIVIQRLFATAPNEILIAPRWGKTRHETLRDIEAELKRRNSRQGALAPKNSLAPR